jgi:predicted HD superfamily hydrolase involved in NAD metabolism
MQPLEERVMEYTRAKLSLKRFRHVERVVATIAVIAQQNDLSVKDCCLIGWLHDCAKEEPPTRFQELLRRRLVSIDQETLEQPGLWHGYHAAYIGDRAFGIHSKDLLDAVRYHPTGLPNLSPEGLALFVADYAEPGRPMKWTAEIRKQARTDLLAAALRVCREKVDYVVAKGRKPHSRSLDFLEYLKDEAYRTVRKR